MKPRGLLDPDPKPTISARPRGLLMEALDRYAPRAYDAVRSAQREVRQANAAPNPFSAVAKFLGLDQVDEYGAISMIEGPAAATAIPVGRAMGRALTSDAVRGIANNLRQTHGLEKLDLSLVGDALHLGMIQVPRDARGRGVGSAAMSDILRLADENGLRVTLTPEARDGSTSRRLADFYKRLGFVENKGRNKDFTTRERMIREPNR